MYRKFRVRLALSAMAVVAMLLLAVGNMAVAQDEYVDPCLSPEAIGCW